jgi:ubiquinone/menaquinone biosynthesis C-methylase UbiE
MRLHRILAEASEMMFKQPSCIAVVGGLALAISVSQAALGQIASRPAEDWAASLDQAGRIESLNIDEVVARLRIKPGDVVADLGAGTGVFSVPFAKAASPGGKVYAVEIDEGFFQHIAARAADEGADNVETVLGEFSDPNLPSADVDLAFFHDVLHHIEDREGYLRNLARYVKPSGRVAIIDFGDEQGPHQDQADMRLTREAVSGWMENAGFEPAEEHFDVFDDKFFIVYSRQ